MKTFKMYSGGGLHYLLQYHTHNLGNRIILSRNKDNILDVFKYHVDKLPGIKHFASINIVSPTLEMYNKYKENCFNDNNFSFWSMFSHIAMDYYREHRKLPSPFSLCPNYSKLEGYHYCDDCSSGIIISLNEEEKTAFFIANRHKVPGLETNSIPSLPIINAEMADTTKHIYVAEKNFGHHDSGLTIQNYNDDMFFENIFFFFQDMNALDPSIYNDLISNREERLNAENKMMQEKYKKNRAEQERHKFDNFLNIFKD